MAITVGTITLNKDRTNVHTWNHNHSGGDDNILIILRSSDKAVNGITYNSVAMTQGRLFSSGGYNSTIYYIVNPPSGVHEVRITSSQIGNNVCASVSLSGVDTDTPIGNTQQSGGSSDAITLDIVSTNAENMIFDVASRFVETGTVGDDQTQVQSAIQDTVAGMSSYETGAGTKTMSWSFAASRDYSQVAVEINALVEKSTSDFFRLF